jgi:choline kinase
MKAIVLSAGQGKRLLPWTETDPKCLLPVDGERPMLEVQLRTLARCGVERATVLVGFGAERVERFLETHPVPGLVTETIYNPFYDVSDNLVTCWLARTAMTEDFVLLNGDTLFEERVLARALEAMEIAVTVDHKARYDDDDMKVSIDPVGRLRAVGKRLAPETVNGESIGLLAFRGSGVKRFRDALEEAIRRPESKRAWYLSVVNALARRAAVETISIHGLWWCEIDSPEDLAKARAAFADGGAPRAAAAAALRT